MKLIERADLEADPGECHEGPETLAAQKPQCSPREGPDEGSGAISA